MLTAIFVAQQHAGISLLCFHSLSRRASVKQPIFLRQFRMSSESKFSEQQNREHNLLLMLGVEGGRLDARKLFRLNPRLCINRLRPHEEEDYPCDCHEGVQGGGGTAPLILHLRTRLRSSGQQHALALLTPGK
jgi:hypothetical protein